MPPGTSSPVERAWASDAADLGHLRRPRGRRSACCRRRLDGLDVDRARLRHRLRVGLAGPPRRAAGRHRQLAGPARDGAAAARHEFGVEFPLHLGNAEQTPFPDESFDLAISEYGASIWCDPYRWIPEAARLLRPGRTADLPGQRRDPDALRARRRERAGHRSAAARLLRHAPLRVARRHRPSSSISATAT